VNLRVDPFERAGLGRSQGFINWYQYEFWRFVLVQQIVGQYAQTFIDYPPMQKGASFNLEQLKEELQKKAQAAGPQSARERMRRTDLPFPRD